MAMISRLGRLLRADAHAVLDQLEEPEALLRQALREMDASLLLSQQQIRQHETELAQLDRRLGELSAQRSTSQVELDLCLDAGNESLARHLLRRRLQGERLTQLLAQQQQRVATALTELRSRAAAQQERLDDLRQRAALFDRGNANVAASADPPTVSEADVELALLREKQRRAS